MAKSSAYPPLDSLVDLACRDGVDIRPTLLRVLTDLYVQKPVHSAEEETQYVELARGLIDAVDATTLRRRRRQTGGLSGRTGGYPRQARHTLYAAGRANRPKQTDTRRAVRNDLLEVFFAATSDERRSDFDQSRRRRRKLRRAGRRRPPAK